jgi:gluconate 2-dehydrogenase
MKPAVLIARAIYPETLDRLRQHFEVEANPDDHVHGRRPSSRRGCRARSARLTTGSERIDAAVLDAHPALRVVANMAVGYNNLDIAAFDARGVLATNTPDVLTETTADFGFALMMATARRMSRERTFPARREMDEVVLRHVRRRRGAWQPRWASWAWAASARRSRAAARWASACA